MMRTAILFLCLSFAGLCYAATYQAAPQKPVLLIVHANWCMPCRNLDQVFLIDPEFSGALRRAFEIRYLDWQVPSDRATAERLGVTELPTMIVMRGERKVAVHTGFSCDMSQRNVDRAIKDLMNSLHVEWPPPQEKPIGRPASQERPRAPDPQRPAVQSGPMIDEGARNGITRLASETKQLRESQAKTEQLLQELHGLQAKLDGRLQDHGNDLRSMSSEVRESIEQLTAGQNSTEARVRSIGVDLKASIERTIVERLKQLPSAAQNISTEIPATAATAGTGSKWLSFVGTAAKIGLTIAAPEIAIPGAAVLTAAGYGLSLLRRRRAGAEVTGAPLPQLTKIVPIAVDAPPSPQIVNTETHFVPVERDSYQQAHAWAKEQLARRYPGAAPTLETLDGLIQQHLAGRKD